MTAEREALKLAIEYLTVLFPTEVSSFVFQVGSTDRTVQYKLTAQSLRLFGLHSDVNDAHRAGANRLQKKQNKVVADHLRSLAELAPLLYKPATSRLLSGVELCRALLTPSGPSQQCSSPLGDVGRKKQRASRRRTHTSALTYTSTDYPARKQIFFELSFFAGRNHN